MRKKCFVSFGPNESSLEEHPGEIIITDSLMEISYKIDGDIYLYKGRPAGASWILNHAGNGWSETIVLNAEGEGSFGGTFDANDGKDSDKGVFFVDLVTD